MSDKLPYSQFENRLAATEKELTELRSLYSAATQISENLSLEDTLKNVAVTIINTLRSNGCSVSRWHRDKNKIETLLDYNNAYPEEADRPGRTYDLTNYPATHRALTHGQTLLLKADDPLADEAETALMKEHFTNLMVP